MKVLFLTLSKINSIEDRGIYPDLMRKFRNEGHDVFIMRPSERRYDESPGVTIEEKSTIIKVKTLNVQKTNVIEKGFSTLILPFLFKRAINHYLDNIKFDLILFSTPPITFTGLIKRIKKHSNAKVYLLLKDIFPQNAIDLNYFSKRNPVYWYFRRKEKKLYRSADFIGCMSPANVDYIKKYNPSLSNKTIEVCPNSIEPLNAFISDEEREKIRAKYGIPQNAYVFIYGGNLGRPQGLDFLIRILEDSVDLKPAFFLIIGSGNEYKRLEKWFNRFKPPNAKLLPAVPKNDFDQLIQAADAGMIFLSPHFTIPNFPSRLLSYLECSMPVIAATDVNTDLGKIIQDNGLGLWCKNGDAENFMEHLRFLLSNKEKAKVMGQKGRQFLEDNYLVSDACDRILKHFGNV